MTQEIASKLKTQKSMFLFLKEVTLSETTPHSTVFHHLSHLSVDIQYSGLIKFKENSGVQTQLT